ncbi:uncharacterized protein MYCFIDRAFT_173404 [Pseudocercospora fijiensis CIRAD86]|uniref:Uncharacterized protein n=1 Tax=Pseudocercospora fijiensis (strain CIRAD86) TaxID=383855 RepID=M3B4V6_PSEFD|nr:uncharacterized protein MYCFIDRAFT_173404 [Pseudocercospora fijiensis CIRAD86]EME84403.1 hypothetical protein MYCFIDRAFT_173404 [Pseudocercospora fijiensis CIRAD86]
MARPFVLLNGTHSAAPHVPGHTGDQHWPGVLAPEETCIYRPADSRHIRLPRDRIKQMVILSLTGDKYCWKRRARAEREGQEGEEGKEGKEGVSQHEMTRGGRGHEKQNLADDGKAAPPGLTDDPPVFDEHRYPRLLYTCTCDYSCDHPFKPRRHGMPEASMQPSNLRAGVVASSRAHPAQDESAHLTSFRETRRWHCV